MNYNTIKEGRKIVDKKKVELMGTARDRDFWKVAGHSIIAYNESSGVKFNCECKHCSIHSISSPSCSFVAALIYYLAKNHGKTGRVFFKKELKKKDGESK